MLLNKNIFNYIYSGSLIYNFPKMKSKLSLWIMIPALLITGCIKISAQNTAPWAWAKAFYRTNTLVNPTIAVDPSGSGAVYTTGSFLGTVDFDPGPGIFNLDSLNYFDDMFISKLDVNGDFVWAKQISESTIGTCTGYGIAVDPSGPGDVYTTGAFLGHIDFDPGPGTFILDYAGYAIKNPDVFVSKLDSSGLFKWAVRMGGTGEAWGQSIAVDPLGSGDVYILGSYTRTIDFNPGGEPYELTSNGKHDFFIVKLDRWGKLLWAKSIGGTGEDFGFAMALDPQNSDVVITGDFTGQVNFNPEDSSHIFTSGPSFDIFILKLNSEGDFVWLKPMYGAGSNGGAGYGIAIDPNGSGAVFTTGYFEGEVDFDPDPKGIYFLNSVGMNDVFISKLDRKGNFVWAKSLGGMGDDKGSAIAFDPEVGGVYIMGNFTQTVDFDPDTSTTFPLTSIHSNDIFISRFYGSGDFHWAKPVLANQANQNSRLVLAPDGKSLYVTGLFLSPTISFDNLVLTDTSNIYSWSVFVSKLNTTISTSVTEFKEPHINIYPNPAINELTIEFEGDIFQDVDLTIFNILGEVVFSSTDQYAYHRKIIDISSLATGLYFIEINVGEEKVVKKIVKE